MKYQSKIVCDCGCTNKFNYKKPTYWMPSPGTFHCDACGSKIKYLVKKIPRKDDVNISYGVMEASDLLKSFQAEDAPAQDMNEPGEA